MAAQLYAVVAAGLLCGVNAAVLRAGRARSSSLETYSFAQFTEEFGRTYDVSSDEYASRAANFQASLIRVNAINAKNAREGRAWSAGVHKFMDWTEAERSTLNGYKPSSTPGAGATRMAAIQTFANAGMNTSSIGAGASWEGVALRQQGSCGSCWAISAVEAVEARLPGRPKLAAQALVDCVPNPQHCGGSGGCDGATGELAYTFMRDHGLPLEDSYSYTAETGSCPMNPLQGLFPSPQRARVSGWTALTSNKAQPLMEALYNDGPVVVAVDANEWFDYDKGIFDGCKKDATLGHAVLAKGYGEEAKGMYWTIQNSWGANWGEQGHIRLHRREAREEEAYCGQDKKPKEGLGCDGGPAEVTVCGMCGILFDPLFPTGVTLESSDAPKPPAQTAALRGYDTFKPADFAMPDFSHTDVQEDTMPVVWSPPVEAVDAPVAAPSDELKTKIFHPSKSADQVKSDMEKDSVDEMKNMLIRER